MEKQVMPNQPPVITISPDDFDPCALNALLTGPAAGTDSGALVSFIGLVRATTRIADQTRQLASLTLEHYPQMSEQILTELARRAQQHWALDGVAIYHRTGRLAPGDQIVFTAVAARHRAAAFAACEYLMDVLKTNAPFWKKEQTLDGETNWIGVNPADTQRLERWRSLAPALTHALPALNGQGTGL